MQEIRKEIFLIMVEEVEKIITVDNLLELLVQLVLTFETVEELHDSFSDSPYDIKQMMEEMLALLSERNFLSEGKQFAKQLHAKLDPSPSRKEEMKEKNGRHDPDTVEGNLQHIM
jgi:hypothetical protein